MKFLRIKKGQRKQCMANEFLCGQFKEANDPLIRQRGICLEKDCKVKKLANALQTCQDRVQSRSNTAETCAQEFIDLMHAVDHCVGSKAFKRLT